MTLKARFSLIVAGAISFLIIAPLAILFARGLRFDFSQKKIIKTGALVVKTDPRGAEIILNGKKISNTTPMIKRLLLPKEYVLEIRKSGYQQWKKRITVFGQDVTYVPSYREKIFLLRENEPPQTIATSTLPFSAKNDSIGEYVFSDDKKTLRQGNLAILEDLPVFRNGEIITSSRRQIMLLLDQALYRVAEKLERVADNVSYSSWNKEGDALIFGNTHEVWLYRPLDHQEPELITRSSKNLGAADYRKNIGYIFVAENNEIKAIEYDPFYEPNVYVLAQTAAPNPTFTVNPEGTHLFYLDGENLYTLKIR